MEKLKKILNIALLSTVLLAFVAYFITPVKAEPSLITVLNELGFNNIQEIADRDVTFPAGTYEVTLYAEFADYHDRNNLSFYEVGKTTYYLIFDGPEGNFGYIVPPITKIVVISYTFGLSMCTPENHRYFTQNSLNPDKGQRHSKVYINNDDPSMYFIGFENLYGAGDRDYQDMVLSLRRLELPQNVIPEVPFGTIATMASMITAMFGFVAFKRFR